MTQSAQFCNHGDNPMTRACVCASLVSHLHRCFTFRPGAKTTVKAAAPTAIKLLALAWQTLPVLGSADRATAFITRMHPPWRVQQIISLGVYFLRHESRPFHPAVYAPKGNVYPDSRFPVLSRFGMSSGLSRFPVFPPRIYKYGWEREGCRSVQERHAPHNQPSL